MKSRVIYMLLGLGALAAFGIWYACATDRSARDIVERADPVEKVVRILDECPDPDNIPPSDGLKRRQILSAMEQLSQFDEQELDEGVRRFFNRDDQYFVGGNKLYILNRYVFAVPHECEKGMRSQMWPLSFDENRRIVFLEVWGRPFGSYHGLREYFEFKREFGRRRR